MKRMWYQKGSYTVEAAFIVPILLGIAFMLMYLILLFHDQMLLQGKFNDTIFCILEKTTSSEEISKQDFNKNLLVAENNPILLSDLHKCLYFDTHLQKKLPLFVTNVKHTIL